MYSEKVEAEKKRLAELGESGDAEEDRTELIYANDAEDFGEDALERGEASSSRLETKCELLRFVPRRVALSSTDQPPSFLPPLQSQKDLIAPPSIVGAPHILVTC